MSAELEASRAREQDAYILMSDAMKVRDQVTRELNELIARLHATWTVEKDETLRLMRQERRG
jgi:hypothetical protein